MRMFSSNKYKFHMAVLCLLLMISVLPPFERAQAADEAAVSDAVYHGFAGIYQNIYADGKKLRDKDGKIVVDDFVSGDMSDQFLPRDMGDGSYAFESRVSNRPHIERQLVEKYDEDYDEWVYEYDDVEVWSGSTRRIAAAEIGGIIPMTNYVFGKSSEFAGMNDNTQHWIRERSESYTDLAPSYYLRSLENNLYIGLSGDGKSLIATNEAGRAEITFRGLNDQSPLYQLSKTEAYAELSNEQRERIERVYESVAGDAFERSGTAMAENASPRGRLDEIYENSKYQSKIQLAQALSGYISLKGGYVTTHRSSNYHVSRNLPGTEEVSVSRGAAAANYSYPNWYHFSKTPAKKFTVYDLTLYGAGGVYQQTIKMWVETNNSSSADNAERFEEIAVDIPFIYRSGITNILIENSSDNSYYSAGQYLYIRLNHPNGDQSILDYVIHEMGHTLDAKRGGGRNWSVTGGEWDKARRADMFSMSSYGASEADAYNAEDFAEFCRYYFTCYDNLDRQRALQILCPNRYELFKQVRNENLEGFSLWNDGIVLPQDIESTPMPTATPTVEPTATPTAEPTVTPTAEPTATPTSEPTAMPTAEPTATPTAEPTATPTVEPTATPRVEPTATPTVEPTAMPTAEPTATPTAEPTATPTAEPTVTPTAEPTATPTSEPTATPTAEPTATPTAEPTATPTAEPTATPTVEPTATPTAEPTATPTVEPTQTPEPTDLPTFVDKYIINNIEVLSGSVNVDITELIDTNAVLIAASYTYDGKLISVAFADVDNTGTVTVNLNTERAAYVSAFIWNSFSDLQPVSNKVSEALR